MSERGAHGVAVTVRLSRDLVAWLDAQEGSRAATVRRAVEELRLRDETPSGETARLLEMIRQTLAEGNARDRAHHETAAATFDQIAAHPGGGQGF